MSSFHFDIRNGLKGNLAFHVSYSAEVEFSSGPPPKQWSVVAATAQMAIGSGFFSLNSFAYINNQQETESATAGMKISSGLQQNSAADLKLYLGCTGSTGFQILVQKKMDSHFLASS